MPAGTRKSRANTTGAVRCRPPTPRDGRTLWKLADSLGLDVNSPYAYVLWTDYFGESSTVAVTDNDRVVGFVNGFRPPGRPDTLFVWQIGVARDAQQGGLGALMLDELLASTGVRWLEATVTPSNAASAALFRGTATRHGTELNEVLLYDEELFPGDHEPEHRFRIGPFAEIGQAYGDELVN